MYRERGSALRAAQSVHQAGKRAWSWLIKTYATVDPRSLGVCRILLGLLIFVDVARRYRDLDAYYTNLGWLTNHFAMFRPMSSHLFSIYHAFSTPGEVRVLFFAHCLVNLLFMVGYRTRLTQLLAIVLLTSLNSRNIIIENGGFVMLALLAIWTWVLPMGQRFSVDAWLRAWRGHRETSLSDLNDRSRPALPVAPVVSLAVTAVILQWAVNYTLNVVHKTGPTWHNGTAVYYFVYESRLLHSFGVWLRDRTPLTVLELLTYGTLWVEGAIAFLWVSPFFSKVARMIAWPLGIGLHLGIGIYATLGPFVWIMMIPYAMFIPREFWEWLSKRRRVRRPKLTLLLDDKNGFALALGRVVKRLDSAGLVRFGAANATMQAATLSIVEGVGAQASRHELTGKAAARRLLEVALFPRWLSKAFLALGSAGLLARVTEGLLAKRRRWSRRLGLDGPSAPPVYASAPSGARVLGRRIARALGELFVVLLLVVSTSQVLIENRAIPHWMKPMHRPEWMTAMVVYPRLFQGWSMFAPDPPRDDGWVVVDGRTIDGRKLDPLTGKEPNFSLDLSYGPNFTAQWEAFHMRIHEGRFQPYYAGFEEYLKNQHLISKRPQDQLVAFDVWYVMRYINAPGAGFTPPIYRKLFGFGQVPDSGVPATEQKGGRAKRRQGAGPRNSKAPADQAGSKESPRTPRNARVSSPR